VLTAAVFLAFHLVPPSLRVDGGETVAGVVFFAAPVLAGVLIGRWWALALAIADLAALAIWGDGCAQEAAHDPTVECDINWWPLLLAIYVPLEGALIAIGVVMRNVALGGLARRARRSAAQPTA
jgi:hypothetical protein